MPNFAWRKAELLIYHMAVHQSFSRNLDKSLITTVPQGTVPVKQSRATYPQRLIPLTKAGAAVRGAIEEFILPFCWGLMETSVNFTCGFRNALDRNSSAYSACVKRESRMHFECGK